MHACARLIPVLALGLAAGTAIAAEDVAAAVRACRGETDAAARLACYDHAVDRAQPAAKAAAAPMAAAHAAATAAPTAAENFGREHKIAAEEQERQQEVARAAGELEATVTQIETRGDGLMTITLDNGQVWRQNRPDAMFRLKQGDHVKIQSGAMKSFILSGPTKKSTRVSRVN
jgi:hypothetical protein